MRNKDVLNQYEINRKDLGELIKDIHKRKPSYGYHRIWKIIIDETGWIISANLVHKVCKILKIKSKAKHYKYKKPGEESVKYENIIGYNWNTSRPFEKVVSDTTSFWFKRKKYDWTFYLDVFNNEIVGSDVRETMYGNGILNHKKAVEDMLEREETIIFYESPHHIEETIKLLHSVFGDCRCVIARELTKLNEEFIRGSLLELIELDFSTLKGEMVILVEGKSHSDSEINDSLIQKRLEFIINKGVSKKAAIEIVSDELKVGKNRVYKIAQDM